MKSLLITLEYPPFKGGVANYYSNLVKYWPQSERIDVISNHSELMWPVKLFSWLKTIAIILNRKRVTNFDYLLVGHVLPLGTAAYLASLFRPYKYGVILHGLDFSLATVSWRKRILLRLILAKADKIICANSHLAKLVGEHCQRWLPKIVIVNPGVETVEMPSDADKIKELKETYDLDKNFALFSLGRLVERKGFDMVIKSLESDAASSPMKYFIAGSGPAEKQLRALADASSCKHRIFFLGELNEMEKWSWLQACDAFIMPAREIGSDFEGFGIVYLEANIAAKPVIAGDSGGVKDAVIDGENGLLVDPKSVEAIYQAILRLESNPELCKLLGEKGKRRALLEFNWEKQAKRLADAIK